MTKPISPGLLILGFVFFLGAAFAAQAQERQDAKTPPPLRKEVVKLKYAAAKDIEGLLRSYKSPFGQMNSAQDANKNEILVISDTPEIIEKMLALIKDFDIKPAEFLFTIQLVLGSEASEDKTDEALKNDPVIKEIRNLLKYKNFSLLDTSLIRTIERKSAQVNIGKSGEYVLDLKPRYIKDEKDENIQMELTMDRVVWAGAPAGTSAPQRTKLIASQISMKSGEKTVVGVSKSEGDKGLILIISGKILK